MNPNRHPRWLPLALTEAAANAAAARGVSDVARGAGGFLSAYRRAQGRPGALGDHKSGQPWTERRAGFVARHKAQAVAAGERWWEPHASSPDGVRPTRRHLALAVWAYSPDPRRLATWLRAAGAYAPRSNPARPPSTDRTGAASPSLPVLAVDPGPSGAAVLMAPGPPRRILGAWAWSWDEHSKEGAALLDGAPAGREHRLNGLDEVGEHIAWRAAQLARGPYRLVTESTWGQGAPAGVEVLLDVIREHAASRTDARIRPRAWVKAVLGLTDEEASREARVYRELQDLDRADGVPPLPAVLRHFRHAWDARAIALWSTGYARSTKE